MKNIKILLKQRFRIIALFYLTFNLSAQENTVEVISEFDKLEKLRHNFAGYLYKTNSENLKLFDRYIEGDTLLLDSIKYIFKSGTTKEKLSLINNMLYPKRYNYKFSSELEEIILNELNFIKNNSDLIWLIGRNNFKQFQVHFEEKLDQCSYDCQLSMLYWLGVNGSSEKGLKHMKQIIKADKIDYFESTRLFDALNNYLMYSQGKLKDEVTDLGLWLYHSKNIYNKIKLNAGEYEAKHFEDNLLHYLFSYGSKKVRPLAETFYKEKRNYRIAFKYLVKNEYKKYYRELIQLINDEAPLNYIGLEIANEYISVTGDTALMLKVINKYYKDEPIKCVRTYMNISRTKELKSIINKLKDLDLAAKIDKELFIRNKSVGDVLNDFVNIGLVNENEKEELNSEVLKFQKETSIQDPRNYFLFETKYSTSFPYESDTFPIAYDEIFYKAFRLSANDIDIPKVYMKVNVSSVSGNKTARFSFFIDFGKNGIIAELISSTLYSNDDFILKILNIPTNWEKTSKQFFIDLIIESKVIFFCEGSTHEKLVTYFKEEF